MSPAPEARARLLAATRTLAPEQRLAALAAVALCVSMFLPWYVDTIVQTRSNTIARESLTAFGAFSFVEAAVLLVSAGVLWMLFARAERRAFHLPGGDGFVIMLAGLWSSALIFYRMLDTPSASVKAAHVVSDVGLQWGIFIALAAAGALAYAGARVRASHQPEPALSEDPTVSHAVVARAPRTPTATKRRPTPADQAQTEQLSFEDEPARGDPFS
ncbi:MAG: hypothetical protein ACR2ND_00780 [Solirubrobacteraceae bacterium]